MIYLDTHVVAWLYGARAELLPAAARALIDADDVLISPIIALELQFLFESSKAAEPAAPVIEGLRRQIGLRRCDLSFAAVVEAAWHENWTRDPFDRIAVAQARLRGAPLLTKDRLIHAHYEAAVWDR